MISEVAVVGCLEQNMLFREGLRSFGYRITSLQGRVVRDMAIDAPRPAIHMLLQIDLPEGPYLADVGFGNYADPRHCFFSPRSSSTRRMSRCASSMLVANSHSRRSYAITGAYLSSYSLSAVRWRV